MGRDDNSGTDT